MKSAVENTLPGSTDWKRFLEMAETLLGQNSLKEQSAFLTKVMADFFQLKSKFWFAHPLYPLPVKPIRNWSTRRPILIHYCYGCLCRPSAESIIEIR